MTNFKKIAQEQVSVAPIMAGKTKLDTDDVVGKEFTIIGFDFAVKRTNDGDIIYDETTGEAEQYGIVEFLDPPNTVYSVGTVFTKVCKAWMEDFDTPAEASEALKAEGGVPVRFNRGKTKKGNQLVTVEIL